MSKTTVASTGIDLSDTFAFTGTVSGLSKIYLATSGNIGDDISNANDANMCGEMFLFDPSSTTFVKHILIQTATLANGDYAVYNTTGTGYANTTSAVNAVQFTMSSGTIDSGTIEMYGIN